VSKAIFSHVLQLFNVKKLHSDNGPAFRERSFLTLMASMNVKVIASAALHPAGRGMIERRVGLVKMMLKKILATSPTFNWEMIPFLLAKIHNATKDLTTNSSPSDMVFGSYRGDAPFMNALAEQAPPHYLVKNNKTRIEQLTQEIRKLTEEAQQQIFAQKQKRNESLNKNRMENPLKVGDYVFHVDSSIVPGQNKSLRTRLSPSPYVVLKPLYSTTLVKRLADGLISLYKNVDLKKFDPNDTLYKDLSPIIKNVLRNKFEDLLANDFEDITREDKLPLTAPVPLGDIDELPPDNDEQDTPDGTQGADIAPVDDDDEENILQNNVQLNDEFAKENDLQSKNDNEAAMSLNPMDVAKNRQVLPKLKVKFVKDSEKIADFVATSMEKNDIATDVKELLKSNEINVNDNESSDDDEVVINTNLSPPQNLATVPLRRSVRFAK
jgi:hypothetical protein